MAKWFTMLTPGDIAWCAISLAIFIASIVLYRRRRHTVATTFLLVGSAAYLAKHIFWNFVGVMMFYRLDQPDSALANLFYPTDASAPWTDQLVKALLFLSVLFPLGLLLSLITALRNHLTKRCSEPLAAPRSSVR